MNITVIGLYSDFTTAYSVERDLLESGFAEEQIDLVACRRTGPVSSDFNEIVQKHSSGSKVLREIGLGGGVGAVLGGVTALLISLIDRNILGLSMPVVAGQLLGMWATIGVGTLAAATIGSFLALMNAGRAPRPGTLITLKTHLELSNKAVHVMNRYSPLWIEQRMTSTVDL